MKIAFQHVQKGIVRRILVVLLCLYVNRFFLSDTHCEPCQSPCLTCKNLTSCLTCNDKLNLLNDQCIEKCPDGYYSNNRQCLQCNPMCGTCIGKDLFLGFCFRNVCVLKDRRKMIVNHVQMVLFLMINKSYVPVYVRMEISIVKMIK